MARHTLIKCNLILHCSALLCHIDSGREITGTLPIGEEKSMCHALGDLPYRARAFDGPVRRRPFFAA